MENTKDHFDYNLADNADSMDLNDLDEPSPPPVKTIYSSTKGSTVAPVDEKKPEPAKSLTSDE